ncbi:UNVERIFIED_CONTAM: hypothetical protein ODX46_01960, partial [Salmonella enterica subsp. enterica serovar Enteritidis]
MPIAQHPSEAETSADADIASKDSGNPFGSVLAEPAQENDRRNVRIVGSAYLPDEERKIDFKA